jgi:hypothetical protein
VQPTGITGESSHTAVASRMTPKAFLTASIHAPERGSSVPADRPTASSGRAHAEPHGEQRRAAEDGVAGLTDVEQGAGQRRGDAGADDDRRERAHRRYPGKRTTAQVAGFFRDLALQEVGSCSS